MKRYELTEGTASKFWQYEVRGTELVVEYGRIGTKGQSTSKSFESEASAQAAADKLVREKTGKGYAPASGEPQATSSISSEAETKTPAKGAAKVARAASAVSTAPKTEPQTASSGSAVGLSWISESELADLASKLAKKSKKSPEDLVNAAVGDDNVTSDRGNMVSKTAATLAVLFERGLLPERSVGDVALLLTLGSDWMSVESLAKMITLDIYPAYLHDLALLKLGQRAPERLAPENDASYPLQIQRLLPLARRKFGLSTESIAEDVSNELARSFLSGHHDYSVWSVRDGKLVRAILRNYAAVKEWVTSFGLGEGWDERVVQQAKTGGFGAPWRALPWLEKAPVEELGSLLASSKDASSEFLFELLETRGDSPEALVSIVNAWEAGEATWSNRDSHRIRETLALVAAKRFAEAGRAIPEELDECLWLLDARGPLERTPSYANALASYPRDRVLARARRFLDADAADPNALEDRTRVPVALGVHADEAMLDRYLAETPWVHTTDRAGYASRLGESALPKFVAAFDAAEGPAKSGLATAIQAILVGSAERGGKPFDAAYDRWFEPTLCRERSLWEAAVVLLPQDRRDAYMVAWAKLDPFEWQRHLPLCSDAAIDAVIGSMFDLRAAKRVHVTYPKGVSFGLVAELLQLMGPRAIPMVKKHFARHPDASGKTLLTAFALTPSDHAACVAVAEGGATPPPERTIDAKVAATLTELTHSMWSESPAFSIKLSRGTLALAEGGHGAPVALGRTTDARSAEVLARYTEREIEGATAGLEAVCLRLHSAPIKKWEEVLRGDSPILDSNVVGLVFADEHAFEQMRDEDRTHVDELISDNTASGDAVATHRDTFLAMYVGEVAAEHRVYWGLDERGRPSCLLAHFVYPE